MAKLAQSFAKYMIYAKLKANGVIEKPDVIGAIFGQTEGLLGNDLDLRELQKTGRIGRIEVSVTTTKGFSEAEITVPSSLDASETSLIAASIETIDKVGPCDAEFNITKVEDVREIKRKYLSERAKNILKDMQDDGTDFQTLSEGVKQSVMAAEVSDYDGVACGPDIEKNSDIIVVEGRADVINLLKNGIKNVIAIEGSNTPEHVINLINSKNTTAFLDGDRGGELDLKKLVAVAKIRYVARAEDGKEVEELGKKDIYKCLRDKIPIEQVRINGNIKEEKQKQLSDSEKKTFKKMHDELVGTRAAYVIDSNMNIISKIPVSELSSVEEKIYAIVIDGKVNKDLADFARKRNIKIIVGSEVCDRPRGVLTASPKEL